MIMFSLAAMLIYYVWAILSRSIELRTNGIQYEEALLKRFFDWNEIESVLIEKWRGQITFQVGGKKIRIHYIGVHPKEFAVFRNEFLSQLKERNILHKYR